MTLLSDISSRLPSISAAYLCIVTLYVVLLIHTVTSNTNEDVRIFPRKSPANSKERKERTERIINDLIEGILAKSAFSKFYEETKLVEQANSLKSLSNSLQKRGNKRAPARPLNCRKDGNCCHLPFCVWDRPSDYVN